MSKKSRILVLLILILVLIPVFEVFAAPSWWPLVPCGLNEPTAKEIAAGKVKLDTSYYQPCTRCDAFRLADNVIHFILEGLVPPVAAVLFIAAGLMIVLAGGNPKFYATGITIFKNAFWGLIIIFASWMIVNTFLKSFAPAQADAPWYRLTCDKTTGGISVGGPPGPPPSVLCSNPIELATQYNVPSTPTNAPELNALVSCVRARLPGENLGSIATYGAQDNSLCNFTRGERVCGSCVHAVNSCHYGGRTGTQGALSVDFGNQAIRDKIQSAACACGAKQVYIEGDHVHVDSRSCDDVNPSAFQCP